MVRDIRIHPVLNGFVCEIGCQTVVFTSKHTMCQEIERYYCDPEGVEEEYIKHAINKTMDIPERLVAPETYREPMNVPDAPQDCEPEF